MDDLRNLYFQTGLALGAKYACAIGIVATGIMAGFRVHHATKTWLAVTALCALAWGVAAIWRQETQTRIEYELANDAPFFKEAIKKGK